MTIESRSDMSHFLSAMLGEREAAYCLVDSTTGVTIASRLEPAFDSAARRKGLLGRDSLERDAALVIAPCNSIHTFFMRFPIDVVFVRRNGEVLKVSRETPQWRIRVSPRAFAVVELAAGVLAERDVDVGHVFSVRALP